MPNKEVVKNFLYYCMPINNWREVTDEILGYNPGIFNGRKLVTICTENEWIEATDYFLQKDFDILTVDHDPKQATDSNGLVDSLKEMNHENGITFRAHTKGVSKKLTDTANARWRKAMFELCLTKIDQVEQIMQTKKFCGSLMIEHDGGLTDLYKTGVINWVAWQKWMYAGSCYWFDNQYVTNHDKLDSLPKHTHTSEYLPCLLCDRKYAGEIGPKWDIPKILGL